MVMVKTPPVTGLRATSSRSVPNVERSSWANCLLAFSLCPLGYGYGSGYGSGSVYDMGMI